MNGEIWSDVVDFEGYYRVSSRGRVMSLPRVVPVQGQVPRRLRPWILKPAVRPSDGRQHVTLSRDGKVVTRTVGTLMRQAGFHQ